MPIDRRTALEDFRGAREFAVYGYAPFDRFEINRHVEQPQRSQSAQKEKQCAFSPEPLALSPSSRPPYFHQPRSL